MYKTYLHPKHLELLCHSVQHLSIFSRAACSQTTHVLSCFTPDGLDLLDICHLTHQDTCNCTKCQAEALLCLIVRQQNIS